MPEDPNPPSNTPPRHRPRLTELSRETTEQDLWDLDDEDDLDAAASKNVAIEPRQVPVSEEAANDVVEEAPEEELDEPELELEEEVVEPSPVAPKNTPVAAPTPVEPEKSDPAPKLDAAPDHETTSPSPSKSSRKEWIGLGVMGAVFIAVGIWWLVGSFGSLPTTRLGEDEPSFPIEGRFAEARSAETFWRKPVREGDNADIARGNVSHIPVVEVTVGGSSNGVLRVIFRDDQGEFVGDSITKPFTSGQFDQTQSPKIEFAATSGFEQDSAFNAYRVGGERWTVEVLEGPSSNASGSEFKLLFKTPISSLQR